MLVRRARGTSPAWGAAVALLIAVVSTHRQGLAHEPDVTLPTLEGSNVVAWPDGHGGPADTAVALVLVVRDDGTVESAELVAPGDPVLDRVALQAARRWSFSPARGPQGPMRAKVRALAVFRARPKGDEGRLRVDSSVSAEPERTPKHQHVFIRGQEPPRSASQITRDRRVLRAAPHRTASDLLLTVPGVFVTQHSGEGKAHQIFFRGFDAVHGQDIEFDVAGVPVNEVSNVHAQGYADLHFVMPEVVSRIEAQPGPYDPRQGDFAVAGTMRYRLGYPEPGITASGQYGSFDTRRAFLAYHPRGEPQETFAAFEAYRTDGFGVGRAAERASGIAQLVHPLSEDVQLRVMASAYAARFGSAGVLRLEDVERGAIGRFDSYDTNQGGYSSRLQWIGEIAHETEGQRLSVAPFVVERSLRLRSNFTGYLLDAVNGDTTEQRNDATTVGFRAAYRRSVPLLSRRDALEAGVYARHDHVDQTQDRLATEGSRFLSRIVDARVRATNIAGYVDAELHPLRRVLLHAGVRVDGLAYAVKDDANGPSATRSAQGLHVGEKATVDVAVTAGLHVVGSYGAGFRSPQARSIGDGEATPFTEVHSGELGVRFRERRALDLGASGYYTRLSNDIVFDETVARNEAVPGTERIGAVAFLTATPLYWFTSSISATYTHAAFTESGGRYQEGDLLPFVPQVVLRSDVNAKPRLGTLFGQVVAGQAGFGFTSLYRRPLPFGELGRNVFVADAVLGARCGFAELRVDLFNLLGADWYDGQFVYPSTFTQGGAPSLLPVPHVTAGSPRTVLVSLFLYV